MRDDLNRNIVAALCYLLGFITGVVILMVETEDRFIRFHAWQSVMATGYLFCANLILGLILRSIGPLGLVASIFNIIFWIVILVIIISSMIRAYHGQIFKLPMVGNWAERKVG